MRQNLFETAGKMLAEQTDRKIVQMMMEKIQTDNATRNFFVRHFSMQMRSRQLSDENLVQDDRKFISASVSFHIDRYKPSFWDKLKFYWSDFKIWLGERHGDT
jgi:hypothetical protein